MSENRATPADAGLYVHVPFCSMICPYCDFAVMKADGARHASFVAALGAEASLWSGEGWSFDSVYLGGGTPSLLVADELAEVLVALESHLQVTPRPWLGIEVNPEDVTAASLAAWRELGFRTLSLGVQSFSDRELAFLGRRHGAVESLRAAERALAAGFETVSLDLIYGFPGQTLSDWRRTLDRAISLAPQHLSCYQLTVHERTVFGVRRRRGELVEMSDDEQAALFFETHERLAAAGYDGYEVSNFAAAREHRSAHNRKYWDHTPYLGLGPSAHSFDAASRWWNEEKEISWRRRIEKGERAIAGREVLAPADLVLEHLMLGFRTREGVDLAALDSRYGVDVEGANRVGIERLVEAGKLERRASRLAPTLLGLAVADSLATALEIPAG